MTDFLSRLREAIDKWVDFWKHGDISDVRGFDGESQVTVLDAAHRYLQGEPLLWCDVHRCEYDDGAPGCEMWMGAKLAGVEPKPCNLVSQWRCPPPEGENP